jgi:hypothetical protein
MVDEFLTGFVIFNLQCQRFIPDVPAKTSDTTHCTLLFSIGLHQKLVGLKAMG